MQLGLVAGCRIFLNVPLTDAQVFQATRAAIFVGARELRGWGSARWRSWLGVGVCSVSTWLPQARLSAAELGREFFCVMLLFGRLTQIEALVSDVTRVTRASFASAWLALSCPGVLAFMFGEK